MGTENAKIENKPLRVLVEKGTADKMEYVFTESFLIGRGDGCQVHFQDSGVSRQHARVVWDGIQWRILDLGSTNGTFIHGDRIDNYSINDYVQIHIGRDGPILRFSIHEKVSARQKAAPTALKRFSSQHHDTEETEGERTRYFRRLIQEQKSRYHFIISIITILLLTTAFYAIYSQYSFTVYKKDLVNNFLEMKSREREALIDEINNPANVNYHETQRKKISAEYDLYVSHLENYYKRLSAEDKLIYKMARVFGECEIDMPQDFVREVKRYIHDYWAGAYRGRFTSALQNADRGRIIPRIKQIMIDHNLPEQFIYLAMVESDFDTLKCGPKIEGVEFVAKGMWQFIPSTARRYGLITGSNEFDNVPDPIHDERCRFDRSTRAAAQYLKDLYANEAFGSGLLAIACYNWGEQKVLPLVESLPQNFSQRNFWQLISHRSIPQETYNHVFRIFSAAVIGEDPRFFRFDFDNPLQP